MTSNRVCVVGGGIAGLTAAFELRKNDDISVTLLEASSQLGGKVQTTPFAGIQLDEGADAFLARVPWAIELAEELGLKSDLVSPAKRSAYIFSYGKLRAIPQPMVLGIPLDLDTLAASGIVSEAGVARAAEDLDRTNNQVVGDEAIGSVVRRRLGDEILERMVDPLIGGINAGDADNLSLDSSAAQLGHAARQGPSFIEELRYIRSRNKPDPDAPVFYAHPEGMGRFVDELATRLGDAVVLDAAISGVERAEDGSWRLLSSAGIFDADAIVFATPAHVTAPLLADHSRIASSEMASIEFASVGLLSLAFERDAIDHPLDGSGFLVPKPEQQAITACSWSSEKWAHLGGTGKALFRISVGHIGSSAYVEMSDEALLDHVTTDLQRLMGLAEQPTPTDVRISRWIDAFPQYTPGHLSRVATIDDTLVDDAPGIFVAGASYRGIGIPACIDQAHQAARSAQRFLA